MDAGEALKFDEAELRANREGRLSARQRNRVFARRRRLIVVLALLTLLIGLLAASVILGLLPGATAEGIVLALGAEALTAGLAFLLWILWQRFRALLAPGHVLCVSGPVSCYVLRERRTDDIAGRPGSRTGYYLRVAEQEFAVSEAALAAIEDGAIYRLYYVARPATLLSMEPAPDDGSS
ncbi:MAG: hypothetical protein OXG07_07770 [Anaerolineaceae bacterium]|nr:hypothetical protein [Anaerolineaceae bacterium]